MKKQTGVIVLLVTISFVLFSCAGLPAKETAASASQKNAGSTATDTPDKEISDTVSTEQSAIDVAAQASGSPRTETGVTDSSMADKTGPAEIFDSMPTPPSGDKLLYFYPEPEPITVPPVPATVTPSKPETVKAATVPSNATKPAQAKPPAVKTEAAKPAVKPEAVPAETADKEKATEEPGIWESEPVSPTVTVQPPALPPSRSATLAVGQALEVWYPGSGWVFLGDASAQNGLGYQTRKLEKADTLFSFKALKPGNYLLNFSRFDVLQDAFSADALSVTVTETAEKNIEKVRAPDYRTAQPIIGTAAGMKGMGQGETVSGQSTAPTGTGQPSTTTGTSQSPSASYINPLNGTAAPNPVSAGKPSSSAGMSDEPLLLSSSATAVNPATALDPSAVLAQAKAALVSGDAVKALDLLNSFFGMAVSSLDEGWYLRAQAYETNGPLRDIRKALSAYETLVSAYPDSSRWKEADSRIRYIKQFYLKIR